MNSILLWLKCNYGQFVFWISLLCCLFSIWLKCKEMYWILFYCIIQETVVLLSFIYRIIRKRQIRIFFLRIAETVASIFFLCYCLFTVYYGYNHNQQLFHGFLVLFCFLMVFGNFVSKKDIT